MSTKPPATQEILTLPAPFLFPQEVIDELTEPERKGEFTLERLQVYRPEVIPEIVRLRGEHWAHLRIARALKVSVNTVAAVDAVHRDSIESLRLKRIELWEQASDQLVAQIAENPGLVPWQVKALAASQLKDKAELMAGRATQRIEKADPVDIEAEWRRYCEKKERALGEGEVLELESSRIGLLPGNSDQLVPADQAPRPRGVPVGAPQVEAGSDIASPCSPRVDRPDPPTDPTASAADQDQVELPGAPAPAPSDDPRGGGIDHRPPTATPNPLAADENFSNWPPLP